MQESWKSRLSSCVLLLFLFMESTAAKICGKRGSYDTSGSISFYMGNFFYKSPSAFSLCADFCKSDSSKCKSFRYSFYRDEESQYCEFFPDVVESYFKQDDSQPYNYYDVDCNLPTFAVARTVMSSTTVTTTSTLVSTTTATSVVTRTRTSLSTRPTTLTVTRTSTLWGLAAAAGTVTSVRSTTVTSRRTLTSTSTRTSTLTRSPIAAARTATTTVTRTSTRVVARG